MIKDAELKRKAMSYCTALGVLPFFEVLLRHQQDVVEKKFDLTDLDVVGLQIVPGFRPRRILFDCKTQSKMSAVNRAFWARGLMDFTDCDEAFVILKKIAPEGHRLAAEKIQVHLFDEGLFDHYAASATPGYLDNPSYLCDLERWDGWRSIGKRSPKLEPLVSYLGNTFPLEVNHLKSLRILIGHLPSFSGEFDPAKTGHIALFFGVLSAFAISMSQVVVDLRNLFTPTMDATKFREMAAYYVWEGKDNYSVRNRLHRWTKEQEGMPKRQIEDLHLPEWDRFLELVRLFLEAPSQVAPCALPLKELSFRSLGERTERGDDNLRHLLDGSNRTVQFLKRLTDYTVRSSGIPTEFAAIVTTEVNNLRASGSTSATA